MLVQGQDQSAQPQSREEVLNRFYELAKEVPSTAWRLASTDETGRGRAQELLDLIGCNKESLGDEAVAAVSSRCIQATMAEGSLFVRLESDAGCSEVDIPTMYQIIEQT